MTTIQIHDEQLARQLRQIAERENRPLEEVLRSMVERYPGETPDEPSERETSDAVKRVRRKAYAKARRYWQSIGDTTKAALTDEELDERFGAFDEEGTPRLKAELKSLEPPVRSLAYAAKIAREANIRTGNPVDAARADDILNEEFADYLLNRMRGEDASE
jgi:predicted ATPase with chaperone activity